ncbi:MAG: hypothetical protein AB1546_15465, partial [bacterium]
MIFVKKIFVTDICDSCYPKFPDTISIDAPPEGNVCKVSWSRITGNYNVGPNCTDPFQNDPPDPNDLVGYVLMMQKDSPSNILDPRKNPTGLVCNVSANNAALECLVKKDPSTGAPLVNGNKYYFLLYGVNSCENYSSAQ